MVSLRVSENAKARTRDVLSRLENRAAKLLGLRQRGGDIFNADEKEHLIVGTLTRADRSVR